MDDLDQKILEMKRGGMSLRKIAQGVGLTHEGVRKRLMALLHQNRVSTNLENQFAPTTIEKKKVSTCSKPHESRASGEPMDRVNPLSTQKPPCTTLTQNVNPSGSLSSGSGMPPERTKEVFPRVITEDGDLFGAIREFLESEGIEVYRMNVQFEAYQIKHNGQVVRFYVQRAR